MQPRAPKLLEDIRSAAAFVRADTQGIIWSAITDDLTPLLRDVEVLLGAVD